MGSTVQLIADGALVVGASAILLPILRASSIYWKLHRTRKVAFPNTSLQRALARSRHELLKWGPSLKPGEYASVAIGSVIILCAHMAIFIDKLLAL